ncbi:hypothetical protein RhiirC2_800381 [Rhizophagus irregularis]|uniref:Uncharacterized protein n=1 Tax=Rhizophagus irregularis TaxID=588596 RepID=A0A2N1M3Q1_9GLOM|nr:hypothetical protein RhiirC2_800381 [Rhizophagus irregularis]
MDIQILSKILLAGYCTRFFNKVFSSTNVVANERFKCTHIEFPMKLKEKSCRMELTVQVPHGNGNKRCPKLLFPLPNLKIQINTDICDGKIWKTFSDTSDIPFFTSETADFHLEIMINLD